MLKYLELLGRWDRCPRSSAEPWPRFRRDTPHQPAVRVPKQCGADTACRISPSRRSRSRYITVRLSSLGGNRTNSTFVWIYCLRWFWSIWILI